MRPPTLSATVISDCQTELEKLKSTLEKRASKEGLWVNLRILTWPFEEKETKRAMDMLHRFHGMFHSALSSDTL